jgi:hypothetical protein
MMSQTISRRELMTGVLLVSAVVPALGLNGKDAKAADLALVDVNDPTAKALDFVTDATQLNASTEPAYKPGRHCGMCAQFRGNQADTMGACNIFTGHLVAAGGWCMAWTQRPGSPS